jgi:hypothetical protein
VAKLICPVTKVIVSVADSEETKWRKAGYKPAANNISDVEVGKQVLVKTATKPGAKAVPPKSGSATANPFTEAA